VVIVDLLVAADGDWSGVAIQPVASAGVILLEQTITQRRSTVDLAHLATLRRLARAFPHAKSSNAVVQPDRDPAI